MKKGIEIRIRGFQNGDAEEAAAIWNQVVEDGEAFPQEEGLTAEEALRFFKEQSFTGVAEEADSGRLLGLYILHPNNVGRCGHICNASYAVRRDARGMGAGESLVRHCLAQARALDFRIMQFNRGGKSHPAGAEPVSETGIPGTGNHTRRIPDEGRAYGRHCAVLLSSAARKREPEKLKKVVDRCWKLW